MINLVELNATEEIEKARQKLENIHNSIEVDNKRNINQRYEITIGTSNYSRITVPPGIIFGFKGLSDSINIVTNISNFIHDDNECENIDKKSFEFK